MDKFSSASLINYEDLRNMMRTMIIERFQMKWHMEDRPVTAYTLVAANPKLKPTADPTERTKCKEGPGPDGKDPRIANPILNRLLTCQNMTIAQIGDELQHVANGYIYNTVTDGTGLKGSYDFTLSFSSADKILPHPPEMPPTAPTPMAPFPSSTPSIDSWASNWKRLNALTPSWSSITSRKTRPKTSSLFTPGLRRTSPRSRVGWRVLTSLAVEQ